MTKFSDDFHDATENSILSAPKAPRKNWIRMEATSKEVESVNEAIQFRKLADASLTTEAASLAAICEEYSDSVKEKVRLALES